MFIFCFLFILFLRAYIEKYKVDLQVLLENLNIRKFSKATLSIYPLCTIVVYNKKLNNTKCEIHFKLFFIVRVKHHTPTRRTK